MSYIYIYAGLEMVNHTHCRMREQEKMDNHFHLHTKGLSVCLDSAFN